MTDPPWASAVRIMAALLILLNVDIVLSVLLGAGYGPAAAVAAAGTLGVIAAEIIARLFPGSDPDLPPLALGR